MIYRRIAILTDSNSTWIYPYLLELKNKLLILLKEAQIDLVFHHDRLNKYDLVFALSYSKIIPDKIIKKNNEILVVHESDLPYGKGFAPITYDVLDGNDTIYFCLISIKSNEPVDSGELIFKEKVNLKGYELCSDLRILQGIKTIKLCIKYLKQKKIKRIKIKGEGSFNNRRYPKDSELDIKKSISEQFNLLRVVDNERYPAYFYYNGKKFIIKISRDDKNDSE